MASTSIGLTIPLTAELSHTQNSDRSVIVTWRQKVNPASSFTVPALGTTYSYLDNISVRVTKNVITKTSGEFTIIETTLEGAGISSPSPQSGQQESVGSVTEEPIQVHPYFDFIVQAAGTGGVTFDKNDNFVAFNSTAANGLAGVQAYLSPSISYRRVYTTTVTPSLVNVGRYFNAVSFPDFPTVTAGANWLLTSISFTSKAGVLNVTEDYMSSDSKGWNKYIYLEGIV